MRFFNRFRLRKEPLQLPEDRLQTLIGGSVEDLGKEFLDYFLILGELEPGETVLDVGCGCGRMTIPLTTFLNKKGEYFGFDIAKDSIKWCLDNIGIRYRNFHFDHANIYNPIHNPTGKVASDKYIFPYPDNKFDFILLNSVFTHLVPKDMEHYMSEISRTLKKNGRCLITFFLLNDETKKLFAEKHQELKFIYSEGVYRTIDPINLESAISYDETYIKDLFSKNNMAVKEPIYYGSWCGRETYLSSQDIIIAKKR